MATLSRKTVVLSDASDLNALTDGQRNYDQISRGPFATEISYVDIGEARVFGGRLKTEVIGSIYPRKDRFYMSISKANGSKLNQMEIDDHTVTSHWGTEQKFWHIQPGFEFHAIELPTSTLDDSRKDKVLQLMVEPQGGVLLRKEPIAKRNLLFYISALETLTPQTEILARADGFEEAFVAHAWSAVDDLFDVIRPASLHLSYPQSLKVFLRARDIVHWDETAILNVPQLANAVGVSERTLSYSFLKVIDQPPQMYLRAFRLNRARDYIRKWAPLLDNVVTEAAMTYGFWHLGRFSAYYKAQFDEYPSETARRNSVWGAGVGKAEATGH